jgi:branched-chain amino acid transport system substrate-binding protein
MNSQSLNGNRNRGRVFASIAAAAALILGMGGCAAADNPEPAATTTNEPIVIGGTLGLTGIYSGPSAAYQTTYQYWADQVNKDGGIMGRQVELIIYDDESNPTVAQQLYQQLINEDKADILLAPYTTAVGGAVVPITERAGKLMVNAGFVAKELHGKSKLMVSTWPYQESEYPRPLFEYIKTLPKDERPKTLAVITAQNPFTLAARSGVEGKGGVLNYAKDLGIDVVVDEEYDQTATDLSSLIQRVKQSDADMLVALSLPNDAALIANTVYQNDYRPDIYCQCGSQVTALPNWPSLGEAGVNVFATTTAWPTQDNAGLKEFSEYIMKELGVPVLPAYAAAGFAAGQVIQQAVEGAKTLDPQKLRDYIGANTFETAVGDIKYNKDGTVAFNALLLQYQEGGNVVIWPTDIATGEAVRPLR